MTIILLIAVLLEGYMIWKLLREVEELRDKISQISKLASPPASKMKKSVTESRKKRFSWKYYN